MVAGPTRTEPSGLGHRSEAARKTILVVDDDPLVLELVRTMLFSEGYRVLVADTGAKALEIARERDSIIHLLLTDVIMPGLNGPQLVERVRALRQDLPVLYMTGGSVEGVVPEDSQFPLVRKPFDVSSLVGTVKKLMGAERQRDRR
jgi:CheY-like chemotaxis protein